MLKKRLFAAVVAAVTCCSSAVTAFAYPWDDPYQTSETSEPYTDEPSYETTETTEEPLSSEEPYVSSEEPLTPSPEIWLGFYYATLEIGEGVQITAEIAYNIWEDPVIGFESSDPSVAHVDDDGYVMAVGEGTAYVTAFCGGVSAYATISVVPSETVPEYISLKRNSFELKIGATAQIEAQILPEDAAEGRAISYETDNGEVAAVNERGLITALKTGTATVTVSGAGLTERVSVTVTSDIAYEHAKLDGYIYNNEGEPVAGAQLVIGALRAVSDAHGYFSFESVEARELNIAVAGNDKAVCPLTPRGDTTVYLLFANDELTRLSSYEELVGHLPISGVSFISGANVILTAGETFELEYRYEPEGAPVTEISYLTSNGIVAEVGQIDGVLTAKAPGEADVTVILNGGQAQASCHVVVNPKESTEHSLLIIVIETIVIAAAAIVLAAVYGSYKKKLNKTLEQYDENE